MVGIGGTVADINSENKKVEVREGRREDRIF
jgi:hypothetical protein